MNIAEDVAKRSTCKRMQVGSLVLNEDLTQITSIGYNGNYSGGPNTCESNEPGSCGCIHSECNALIKAGGNNRATMFITHFPCRTCCKLIVNAGIFKIYYRKKYREMSGMEILKNSGIKIIKL